MVAPVSRRTVIKKEKEKKKSERAAEIAEGPKYARTRFFVEVEPPGFPADLVPYGTYLGIY